MSRFLIPAKMHHYCMFRINTRKVTLNTCRKSFRFAHARFVIWRVGGSSLRFSDGPRRRRRHPGRHGDAHMRLPHQPGVHVQQVTTRRLHRRLLVLLLLASDGADNQPTVPADSLSGRLRSWGSSWITLWTAARGRPTWAIPATTGSYRRPWTRFISTWTILTTRLHSKPDAAAAVESRSGRERSRAF